MTTHVPSRLAQLRATCRAFLDAHSEAELRHQSHPELSPLLWHIGHVFFMEAYWLQEQVFEDEAFTRHWRALYFPELCDKNDRTHRLPACQALRDWSHEVSMINDAFWRKARTLEHPLLADHYLAAFLRQHYAQHIETMRLASAQWAARSGNTAVLDEADAHPLAGSAYRIGSHEATIGTSDISAYDNEQPVFEIGIDAFDIATVPVTNGNWLAFMADGGYRTARYWDDAGWTWRRANGITHPQHWTPAAHGWQVPTESDDPLSNQPIHGISWYEARAFARYAGARLPTEQEWEAACRAGRLENRHQVWEWCDNAFHPYPGFRAYPYDGYSRPWFDGAHFVARGGSRHTEPDVLRPGFRNFYPPTHRHVCAGLRLAW